LVECFEPATKMKANGRKRLLLCDGHDSHISAQFVQFCIDHSIVLFLLPPHSSHLLQALDVGVFGPVKNTMSSQLNRLYATEISRLQKAEWLEHYAKARSIAITSKNICAGWRGAGLFPTNINRILRVLPDPPSIPLLPPRNIGTTQPLLITSSPPDGIVLRTTNAVFNEAISNTALASPV
jgi:DDE superfamily endonuclease